MTHDAIIELLGAYALDAVDPDEATIVADHLAECPRCRAEVIELREVAAHLSHSGTTAPTGVWERIADSLTETPPPLQLELQRRRRRWTRPAAVIGAAAAIIAVAVLSVGLLVVRSEVRDLRHGSTPQLAAQATESMNAPGSRVARLNGPEALAATAVVAADGRGFLLGQRLPVLHGQIYQLWGATAAGTVTSLGTLPGPGIYAFAADPSIHVVMVTVEDGPVPAPTRAAIATGTLA